MPRIRCNYVDCVFLDDGFCGAAAVELDPDEGCMTYTQTADLIDEDEWSDDEELLEEEWEGMEFEEEDDDDDLWLDEEEF